jgi:hypothetical protein
MFEQAIAIAQLSATDRTANRPAQSVRVIK